MDDHSFSFLRNLLDAPAPSGFETAAARVWRAEAETFARDVDVDVAGNSYASVGTPDGPRIMLAGHVDEIGLMVTHVDDEGLLYIDGIGGWDPQVLVGQRIRFLTRKGDIVGVDDVQLAGLGSVVEHVDVPGPGGALRVAREGHPPAKPPVGIPRDGERARQDNAQEQLLLHGLSSC